MIKVYADIDSNDIHLPTKTRKATHLLVTPAELEQVARRFFTAGMVFQVNKGPDFDVILKEVRDEQCRS
jgi:hypothetical protein